VKKMKNIQLIKYSNIVISECPSKFQSSTAGFVEQDQNGNTTVDVLVDLRQNVNAQKDNFEFLTYKLDNLKKQVS